VRYSRRVQALLRQLWAEPRAPDPPPVGRGDVALLLVILGVAAMEVALRPELELGSYHVVAAFLVLPMLLGRRAQPLLMVALTFGGLTLASLVATAPGSRPPAPDSTAFVLMLPYALLRWGSGREVLAGVGVLAAAIGLDQWWAGAPVGDVLGGLAVVSASTAFGASARARERVRRQELAYVRLGERERLARDLHDTVAHHVSAIAIQAQAGLAGAPHRPAAATEALAVISAEASRTLAEMRAMVHVLREADGVATPELTPAPSVTDLVRLAQAGGPWPGHRGGAARRPRRAPACGVERAVPRGPGVHHQRAPPRAARHARDGAGGGYATRRDLGGRRRRSTGGATRARPRAARDAGARGAPGRPLPSGPGARAGLAGRGHAPARRATHMNTRVLIADDQELIRSGLSLILRAQPGIEVVGTAADGHQAVELALRLRPDVCLFDIRMPGIDGIEATRRVAGPGVVSPLAVVVITTFDLDEYVYGALRAGARGFLLKDASAELLVQAILAAARGDALIAPRVTARLLETFAREAPPARPPGAPLTEREVEVLETLARGSTNEEIADELHISLSTVKTHVASLMDKLGARNRVEVAIWAYESGHARARTGPRGRREPGRK
jgi:DNA-binding NarL/FixJ family response regulator